MFTWTLINILPAGGSGTSQYFRKPWPSQKVQKHMIHRPWPERFPWSHPESSRILRAHGASCRWRSDSRLHARQTCWDGSMRFDWTLQVTVVAAVWFYELLWFLWFLWFLPYFLTFHLLCLSKTLTEVASGAGFSSESGHRFRMTGSTWIHHIPRCFLSDVYQ